MGNKPEVGRQFSIKDSMLEAANTVREYLKGEDVTDVEKAVAWVSFLKFNVEQNDEFIELDMNRYVPEAEDAIKAVEDPKERLSLWLQFSAIGLAMKRRISASRPKPAAVSQAGARPGPRLVK